MQKVIALLVILYLVLFSLTNTARAQSVELAPVDYSLPYPGILPDSPVYFLKVWRDQVMTWFISDPVQKSFYTLLLSDKRMAAGEALINSGKKVLGVATVVKANDYFLQAVDLAQSAKKAGKKTDDLVAKLVVAGAKHDEILAVLSGKVSGKEGTDLQKTRQSNTEMRKRIMELLLQK